jgi:hypothetical protein
MKADATHWGAQAHGAREEPLFALGGRWSTIALATIVVVAAVTHFLNLVGFPSLGPEEGNLVRQAAQVRLTWNPYPPGSSFYGQPFLGWYLLALLFALVGFPPAAVGGDLGALYGLYFVPRALMASLAVVDTLLLYLVGRRLLRGEGYGLVAAAIFAVAPSSVWYFRLPLLPVLMVPWLLLALHLALVARDTANPLWALPSALAFAAMALTWFPTLLLLPAFVLLFLLPLLRDRGARAHLHSLIAWAALVLLALLAWAGYAAANGLLASLPSSVGWSAGAVPGHGFGEVLASLLSLDPLLTILGFLGTLLALARGRIVAGLLPPLYLALLGSLAVRWDFEAVPLVPLLALPAALLVADFVGFLLALLPRAAREERRRVALAPALALLLVLALILPGAGLGLARDQNWAPLSAANYIIREAPPYAVVVVNSPYETAIQRARPDLWVVNWWDQGFQVLQNASTNPAARQQTVFLKDSVGNLRYNGPVVGPVQLQLPPGDYVALGRRAEVTAGQVAFHLDRNMALLFLSYGLPPVVLVDPRAPAQGGPSTLTLLDPVAMPKFLLVDDQLLIDAERLPFLRHLAGEDNPTLYSGNNEESIHQVPLPEGVYVVKVWKPGGAFLGSILVRLDGDRSVIFNIDSPGASAQGFELASPLDPSRQHTLVVMVQHANGLPLEWAWVEIQGVNGRAYYVNGESSAEVRVAGGG